MIYENFELQCTSRTVANSVAYVLGTAIYAVVETPWIVEIRNGVSQGLALTGNSFPQASFEYVNVNTPSGFTEYQTSFPRGNEPREALEAWLVAQGLVPAGGQS